MRTETVPRRKQIIKIVAVPDKLVNIVVK